MIAKAVSRYNRISPKKARLVTRPLKGMTVAQAYAVLNAANKKAARLAHVVLKSAFENARRNNPDVKETGLFISKIVADSGPVLKRHRAASMGRASMIRKRTSHFTIHLDSKEVSPKIGSMTGKTAKKHVILKSSAGKGSMVNTAAARKAPAGKRKK